MRRRIPHTLDYQPHNLWPEIAHVKSTQSPGENGCDKIGNRRCGRLLFSLSSRRKPGESRDPRISQLQFFKIWQCLINRGGLDPSLRRGGEKRRDQTNFFKASKARL